MKIPMTKSSLIWRRTDLTPHLIIVNHKQNVVLNQTVSTSTWGKIAIENANKSVVKPLLFILNDCFLLPQLLNYPLLRKHFIWKMWSIESNYLLITNYLVMFVFHIWKMAFWWFRLSNKKAWYFLLPNFNTSLFHINAIHLIHGNDKISFGIFCSSNKEII